MSRKSILRRVNDWLHLWMGLVSGLVVFIVSITGCIYVFEKEVRSVTQPYQFVQTQNKPYLPPSQLKIIAEKAAVNSIQGVAYGGKGMAAMAAYTDKKNGYTVIYINPYSGEVLHKKVFSKDFFRIILMGHYYLWLPPAIESPSSPCPF